MSSKVTSEAVATAGAVSAGAVSAGAVTSGVTFGVTAGAEAVLRTLLALIRVPYLLVCASE